MKVAKVHVFLPLEKLLLSPDNLNIQSILWIKKMVCPSAIRLLISFDPLKHIVV